MKRSERVKLAGIAAALGFLLQIFFLVFDVRFIDESTGQLTIGTELRFRFIDETTREFVLASQLEELPQQLRNAAVASVVIGFLTYLGAGRRESRRTAAQKARTGP